MIEFCLPVFKSVSMEFNQTEILTVRLKWHREMFAFGKLSIKRKSLTSFFFLYLQKKHSRQQMLHTHLILFCKFFFLYIHLRFIHKRKPLTMEKQPSEILYNELCREFRVLLAQRNQFFVFEIETIRISFERQPSLQTKQRKRAYAHSWISPYIPWQLRLYCATCINGKRFNEKS